MQWRDNLLYFQKKMHYFFIMFIKQFKHRGHDYKILVLLYDVGMCKFHNENMTDIRNASQK